MQGISLQLLESQHTFPGVFVFKAIGKTEDDFARRVLTAIREVLLADEDPPHSLREAARGKHVAVTAEPRVQSAAQVLAIYARIRTVDGLVMLL